MRFQETRFAGVYLVQLEPHSDERGFFARTYCSKEFAEHGITTTFVQCNVSFNAFRGTLRGMHYQVAPMAEPKLVRCFAGAIYDVVIDLRSDSVTYGNWQTFELTDENWLGLYIPEGFAHGFQTLLDNTQVFYQMGNFYSPEHARGIRWNDPTFSIRWPIVPPIISDADRQRPDFVL